MVDVLSRSISIIEKHVDWMRGNLFPEQNAINR